MRRPGRWLLLSSLLCGSAACLGSYEDASSKPPEAPVKLPDVEPRRVTQVAPPLDLRTPPADAVKTGSGLVYKKLVTNAAGPQPGHSDTAVVHYTGWSQRTGTTFFTTKGRERPIGLDLAHAAPGFAEALQLLHKGEKVVLWMPPSQGVADTLVYEVEVVDIVTPPAIAKRSPNAETSKSADVARSQQR